MLVEQAIVIRCDMGWAEVKCQSQSACGGCSAKNACGTSLLSELNGSRGEYVFTIKTITPLKVGQLIEIGLSEQALIKSALLLYCIPLLVLLLSTWVSSRLFSHELVCALFIFVLTACAFWVVRLYTQRIYRKQAFQPVLLKIINDINS